MHKTYHSKTASILCDIVFINSVASMVIKPSPMRLCLKGGQRSIIWIENSGLIKAGFLLT